MSYEDKYLKYKNKYLSLKHVLNFNQIGGASSSSSAPSGGGGASSSSSAPIGVGGAPSGGFSSLAFNNGGGATRVNPCSDAINRALIMARRGRDDGQLSSGTTCISNDRFMRDYVRNKLNINENEIWTEEELNIYLSYFIEAHNKKCINEQMSSGRSHGRSPW